MSLQRLLSLLMLFLTGIPLWSQEVFSLEGTAGSAVGDPEIYSLSMVGRLHFNKTFSAGAGIGLWNSGFTTNWFEKYNNQTATLFNLSDNQTVPSFQINLRGEKPLLTLGNKPLHVFVEPGLFFLPLTSRAVTLSEDYFTGVLNPVTNEVEYNKRSVNPAASTQLTTDSKPLFGWELKGGLSLEVKDNIACSFSCAYQQLDLFQRLKTSSINSQETNEHIELHQFSPPIGRIQLQLGFVYFFPLK